jgi:4-aminobutyrate aminotransferase
VSGVEQAIAIRTELPGPRARAVVEQSLRYEPRSMSDQVPAVWQRAEGCFVEDVDGNVFLDFSSGVLVANVGHSHPRVVAAIREQAGEVINCYDFVTEWRARLAGRLVEITPDPLDRAFIVTTGSEAVEAALKIARRATGRREIVAFHGAFHGRTYGAMSVGGNRSGAGARGFGPFLPGVVLAPFPNCYRCPCGLAPDDCGRECFGLFERTVAAESENDIAAVIVESYQGAAGSIVPPAEWMQALERWCRERDVVLIMDEVQASFGRTGRMFGFEHFGVTPNLLCLGKGISSTVPLAALVGEARLMDVLEPGSLSSTHGGNPLCCRAGLASIDVIRDEHLAENAARVGEVVLARLREMVAQYSAAGDARGLGLALALEIVRDKRTKEPDPDRAKAIVRECYQRGLLMIAPIGTHGNVLRISPPLVITEEQALTGCRIIADALAAVSS